jgi:hypothetical protein
MRQHLHPPNPPINPQSEVPNAQHCSLLHKSTTRTTPPLPLATIHHPPPTVKDQAASYSSEGSSVSGKRENKDQQRPSAVDHPQSMRKLSGDSRQAVASLSLLHRSLQCNDRIRRRYEGSQGIADKPFGKPEPPSSKPPTHRPVHSTLFPTFGKSDRLPKGLTEASMGKPLASSGTKRKNRARRTKSSLKHSEMEFHLSHG